MQLSVAKGPFTKGYLPNWTEQIYTVSEVLDTTEPVQYKLQDYYDEEIKGSFYAAEIQKVASPEEFAIEEVIRMRKVGGRKQ